MFAGGGGRAGVRGDGPRVVAAVSRLIRLRIVSTCQRRSVLSDALSELRQHRQVVLRVRLISSGTQQNA